MGATVAPATAHAEGQRYQDAAAYATTAPAGSAVAGYDPFYDDPVPAEQLDRPGKIVREQPTRHLLNVLGPDFPGHAKRILYTSTTVDGEIVPVSGIVIEPANPWRGNGPTPTVVFGPGTRGSGDACAPSRGPWFLGQVDPSTPAVGTNYELHNFHAAALLGMRVVVTDYIGLGTPGPHTYVLNDEQGHAMLDAARAVAPQGDPVGFWGYSQGGGAAAAAAELASTYAPDVNIQATYAGAPPANLVETMLGVDGSSILAVLGYALYGWSERYPDFREAVDQSVNARGREFLATTTNACIADSAARWGLQDSRTLTRSGRTISEVVTSDPTMLALLEQQNLGRKKPAGPILISTPGNDDLVPSPQVVQLARDHCSLGGNVTLLDDGTPAFTPSLKSGANHAYGMFSQAPPAMKWMIDRFNGVPASSNCGTF